MKKPSLLSFTHSNLIHRLFWNTTVGKNFISFLDYSSLWFLTVPSRNTNQEQKISSDSKIINGKIKAEARPQRPNRPWGPQLEQHQPLAQPITKESSNRNGKRFQIQTPKT
ncbi:hypothetical protein AVEN_106452-1 [Araneus ventricosus]|uniref:Uncharacterized protein n=1 Tax=Araneus ventricosus TaxID=182803 RepID=A0A4Y2AUU8_ARAVE|nr:hypothetical protein AVEN_106452-1 [Araneus ventricosus]